MSKKYTRIEGEKYLEAIVSILDQISVEDFIDITLTLFTTPTHARGFMYFMEHGVATCTVLMKELDLKGDTAYRIRTKLRDLGLIEELMKLGSTNAGGRRAYLYGTHLRTDEQVYEAIKLHHSVVGKGVRMCPKCNTAGSLEPLIEDKKLKGFRCENCGQLFNYKLRRRVVLDEVLEEVMN